MYLIYIKLVLLSNYYKSIVPIEEIDLLKYTDIGFNKIEIFDKSIFEKIMSYDKFDENSFDAQEKFSVIYRNFLFFIEVKTNDELSFIIFLFFPILLSILFWSTFS